MNPGPATTPKAERAPSSSTALLARLSFAVALAVLATACQSPGDLAQPVESDPRAARQALAQLASGDDAVATVIHGDLAGLSRVERNRLVTSAFEEGVRGLDVTFRAVPEEQAPDQRLVVLLDSDRLAEGACAGAQNGGGRSSGQERIVAAFCRGDEALGAVAGTVEEPGARARQRVLWRMAGALFPDDYQDTYGLGVLPDWLGVGVGGSIGF